MKNKKKLVMALALGVLTLSGFAINAYAMDNASLNSQQHSIKEVKNNPFDVRETSFL